MVSKGSCAEIEQKGHDGSNGHTNSKSVGSVSIHWMRRVYVDGFFLLPGIDYIPV